MATYTPPPYFPQQSLAPPDARRYRRFKLAAIAIGLALLMLLGGVGLGAYLLAKSFF